MLPFIVASVGSYIKCPHGVNKDQKVKDKASLKMDSVKEFEVSLVTSKQLMHDFVLDYCQRQNWSPGKMEDLFYWVAGPGVYVGKLNGQPITGVGMFQHNKMYAYVSMYFCEQEHRGKGYGLKTWMTAKASLNPRMNIGLDAEESVVHLYEREGFKRAWNICCYLLNVPDILNAYTDTLVTPAGLVIKPAEEVNFQKLKLYIEGVIGIRFDRPCLLENWIAIPSHTALAAENSNGDIVGFATLRDSLLSEKDYMVIPLLAETSDVARILLLEIAKEIDPKQMDTAEIEIDISVDINPETKAIMTEVNGKFFSEWPRMYSKQEPPIQKSKYFGIFTTNILG